MTHEHRGDRCPLRADPARHAVVDLARFDQAGNQVRAATGTGMVGFGLATVGVFVVALTIPEAWADADGA